MGKKLTNRDQIFVLEYLVDLDVERAAIVAGYSKSMAASKAYQWVRKGKPKPHIFESIQSAFKKRELRTERTAGEVLDLLWKMNEYSLEDYFDINEAGEITAKRFDQLKPGAAKLINGIKYKKQALKKGKDEEKFLSISDIEYKMPNRDKMIELLMRHHGLLVEKHEVTGRNGSKIKVEHSLDATWQELLDAVTRDNTDELPNRPEK